MVPDKSVRLDRFLSDSGLGTRSEVKKLIRRGQITIDGIICSDPAVKVTEDQEVAMNGETLVSEPLRYYMLHKPSGCVCAAYDRKYPTIFEYVPQTRKNDLASIGRLDLDTEGLLIVTNDGALNHRLLAPSHHVDKTYYTEVTKVVTEHDRQIFASCMDIGDDTPLMPAVLTLMRIREETSAEEHLHISEDAWKKEPWLNHDHGTGDSCCLVTIQEGRYHQVRRMFEACGHEVTYLKRLRMGSLVLDPNLKPGEYRPLTEEELALVKKY